MELSKLYEKIGTKYKIVLERFCNDEDMLSMFVMSFPDDPTYGNLASAMDKLNYTEIENHAHTLKGISANLGFDALQNACSEVVLCIRQHRLEAIQQDFQKVEREYAHIVEEIYLIKDIGMKKQESN